MRFSTRFNLRATTIFDIYINDLATVSEKVFSILFADDTNIFLSDNNLKEMTETFNVELTKIHKWLQVNKLSINIDKTNYMIFRSKKKHKAPKINIAIDGKILEMLNQTKSLGVLMDEFLSWKAHINHVASKLQNVLGY